MIELEVGVHFKAGVERLDGVPVAPVAVVQESDPIPKPGVLQSARAATKGKKINHRHQQQQHQHQEQQWQQRRRGVTSKGLGLASGKWLICVIPYQPHPLYMETQTTWVNFFRSCQMVEPYELHGKHMKTPRNRHEMEKASRTNTIWYLANTMDKT